MREPEDRRENSKDKYQKSEMRSEPLNANIVNP